MQSIQIEAVNEVLNELDAFNKPMILVLNKIDKASEENILKIKEKYKNLKSIEISAKVWYKFRRITERSL